MDTYPFILMFLARIFSVYFLVSDIINEELCGEKPGVSNIIIILHIETDSKIKNITEIIMIIKLCFSND